MTPLQILSVRIITQDLLGFGAYFFIDQYICNLQVKPIPRRLQKRSEMRTELRWIPSSRKWSEKWTALLKL